MTAYKIRKVYHQYYYATIEADSLEQAQKRAEGLTIQDCLPDEYAEWEVYSVDAIALRPLTPDELAFMSAYQSNVADAPPDVVEGFLRAEDGDSFCKQYGNEYYTGLADAWGVWEEAMDYARGGK